MRALVLAVAAALLAGCAGSSGSGALAGPEESPTLRGRPAVQPAALERVDWQLITITQDGATRDVADLDATLRFDGKGHVGGQGCNHFGGDVQTSETRITASDIASTEMACIGPRSELDQILTKPLTDGATWSINGGELTIRGADLVLTFRPRDAVFPTRDATPIVQGEIGDATYRLAWRADNDTVSVEWEAREDPGTGFGTSGIGRSVHEDITYLDPMASTVARKAFIYVAAPRTIARMTWVPATGEPLDLTSYDVPPATTWRIYAGFVGSASKGGAAVAYDGDGNELMRSRVLPY